MIARVSCSFDGDWGRRPWGRSLGEGLAERLGLGGLVGDRDLHPSERNAVDGPAERFDVRGLAVDRGCVRDGVVLLPETLLL